MSTKLAEFAEFSREQQALSQLSTQLRRLKQAQRLVRNARRDNESNFVQLEELDLGFIVDKLDVAVCKYAKACRKAAGEIK